MCGSGTIIYIAIGFIGEGEKIKVFKGRRSHVLFPVGLNPDVPDLIRHGLATLGFMSDEIQLNLACRIESG